jgi:CheY-like chemotaxis protein
VDDSALNRDIAAEMLKRLGCLVEVADDGRAALELASRETFELVLMDLEMGGMDGYEATRRLRSEPGPNADVPVVAATASAFESDRRRALEAGMDDVLPKPFGLRELSAMLGCWLGQSVGPLARRNEQTEIQKTTSLYPRATAHLATLLGEAADGPRIDRVVQAFLAQWPERASRLREAFSRRDADKAREILHALSGSASYLGVSSIDGLIARLHHRARQHDLGHTAELDQLEALIAELGESRERFERARTGTLD